MSTSFDENYWSARYNTAQTQWDIGSISRPLKEYFDQLSNTSLKILIPGCGNAYEAQYLFDNGFKNVHLVDLALEPLTKFQSNTPDFPDANIHHDDFFNLEGSYDLIIEQTFFCALDPSFRAAYADKVNELLTDRGKLIGLLFDDLLNSDRPPFGGSYQEYYDLFNTRLSILKMEKCYNSIKPRMNRELFIAMGRK